MSKIATAGTVVEFTPSVKFDDGQIIVFTPSRPSKMDCLMLGWEFYDADDIEQTELLNELGPVLVRRSLQVFSNYAARNGQREVAEYAVMLREDITILRDSHDDIEQAS